MANLKTVISGSLPLGEAPSENSFFEVGQVFNELIILKELGRGAIATVYLARQMSLNRDIALKVSRASGSEGKALAQLDHPHIVRVYADGWDNQAQLRTTVMQYVPGLTLGTLLEQAPTGKRDGNEWLQQLQKSSVTAAGTTPSPIRGLSPLATILETSRCLAEAVAHAHARGIVHLDIKPHNILLNLQGEALLADFNVSGLGDDLASGSFGSFGGTPEYMSPEQAEAVRQLSKEAMRGVSFPSDIYSLGRVMQSMIRKFLSVEEVELLTNADAEDHRLIREWHLGYIRRTLLSMLHPDPQARPSASALVLRLKSCQEYAHFYETIRQQPAGRNLSVRLEQVYGYLLLPAGLATLFHLLSIPQYPLLGEKFATANKNGLLYVTPFIYLCMMMHVRRVLKVLKSLPFRQFSDTKDKKYLARMRFEIMKTPVFLTFMVGTLYLLPMRAYGVNLPVGKMQALAMVGMILHYPLYILGTTYTFIKAQEWLLLSAVPLLAQNDADVGASIRRTLGEATLASIRNRKLIVMFPLGLTVLALWAARGELEYYAQSIVLFRLTILAVFVWYQLGIGDQVVDRLRSISGAVETFSSRFARA